MPEEQPAGRPEEQTSIGQPVQRQADAASEPGGQPDGGTIVGQAVPASEGELCPACYQPLEPDSRFCQACGAETRQPAQVEAAEQQQQPRWLPLVMIGMLVVMVIALVFLLSVAIQVG